MVSYFYIEDYKGSQDIFGYLFPALSILLFVSLQWDDKQQRCVITIYTHKATALFKHPRNHINHCTVVQESFVLEKYAGQTR